MNSEKMKKYAPALLRTAIAIVFLWFGFSQLKNPTMWTRMVPEYVLSMGLSATSLVYIHGTIEIILAVLLLLGLYTKLAALLLGLNLLHIVFIVGYGPTGARDFAIALAALSIFLFGPDEFCLDRFRKKKN